MKDDAKKRLAESKMEEYERKVDVERLAQAQSEEEWKNTLASLATQLACTVKQRSVQNAVGICVTNMLSYMVMC